MKSLADKFRQLLAQKTQEEFEAEWAEIEALGLEGPLAKDFIRSFHYTPAVRPVTTYQDFGGMPNENLLTLKEEESSSFAMAA